MKSEVLQDDSVPWLAQQSRGDSCLQHGAAVDGDEAATDWVVVVPERIGASPDRELGGARAQAEEESAVEAHMPMVSLMVL